MSDDVVARLEVLADDAHEQTIFWGAYLHPGKEDLGGLMEKYNEMTAGTANWMIRREDLTKLDAHFMYRQTTQHIACTHRELNLSCDSLTGIESDNKAHVIYVGPEQVQTQVLRMAVPGEQLKPPDAWGNKSCVDYQGPPEGYPARGDESVKDQKVLLGDVQDPGMLADMNKVKISLINAFSKADQSVSIKSFENLRECYTDKEGMSRQDRKNQLKSRLDLEDCNLLLYDLTADNQVCTQLTAFP